MNDMVDTDTDEKNKRKGNYIFGAKAPLSKLTQLPLIMFGLNAIFIVVFTLATFDFFYLVWYAAALGINAAYNWKPLVLSRRAPWEVPCMVAGHFLIPILACRLNDIPHPGVGSWAFHALLLARSHLWLEMMDISEDVSCGKNTIAVCLGERLTFLLILSLTAMESWVGFHSLHSELVGFFSAFGALILVVMEASKCFGYSIDMKFVSICQSLVGAVLMLHVWRTGDLLD
jgi:1,4-dihydroxy-2-naphthoate octaprenyltransferase